MRLPDHRQWVDSYDFNFLTAEGYLTEKAKELMKELKCYTLEDLLNKLERSKSGDYADTVQFRDDVKVSGWEESTNVRASKYHHEKE